MNEADKAKTTGSKGGAADVDVGSTKRSGVQTRAMARSAEMDDRRGLSTGSLDGEEAYDDAHSGASPAQPAITSPEERVHSYNARMREIKKARAGERKLGKRQSALARKEVIREYKEKIIGNIPEMATDLARVGLLSSSSESEPEGAHTSDGTKQSTVTELLCGVLPKVIPAQPARVVQHTVNNEAHVSEPTYWTGNVEKAAEDIVNTLIDEHTRLDVPQRELLGGTMKGLTAGRLYNKLLVIPGGIGSEKDYEVACGDITSERRMPFSRPDGKEKEGDRTEENHVPQKRKLSTAAATLARRMAGTPEAYTRIRGFVAGGSNSPLFCGAVCAKLLNLINIDLLRRTGGSVRESRNLLCNIEIWARKAEGEAKKDQANTETSASELKKLANRPSVEVMAVLAVKEAGLTGVRSNTKAGGEALVLNKLSASLLIQRRVCPYCLAASLSNEEPAEVTTETRRLQEISGEALARMISDGSAGAAAAMARAHNKEMHALNGNIFFSTGVSTPRTDVVGTCVTKSLAPMKHRHVVRQPEASRIHTIQEEIPMITYGMTTSAGVSLMSAPPTRHQVHWYQATLAEPDADILSLNVSSPAPDAAPGTDETCQVDSEEFCGRGRAATAGGSRLPVSAARVATSLRSRWVGTCSIKPRADRHREIRGMLEAMARAGKDKPPLGQQEEGSFHQLVDELEDEADTEDRELTWIGIGEDTAQNKGGLSLTTAGAEVSRIVDDPTVRDGRVNSTYARHVWRYLADSPLLQSVLTEGSGLSRADITPLLLKARLYDHMRHHSTGFPSGVEWAVPLKAPTPYNYRICEGVADMLVCAVSTRYLDEVCHSGMRSIPTDDGEWRLDDPEVGIVCLDYNSTHTTTLWALQLLMSAPYPLVSLDEFFVLTGDEGPDELKLVAMRRNECCVSINNRRNRFILVHTTGHAQITFCGHTLDSARLGRARDLDVVPTVQLLPLCRSALNIVLASPLPLREVLRPWVRQRCSDEKLDWTAVDEVVSWATMRFLPQPEVHRDEAGVLHTTWLPRTYRVRDYATHNLPQGDVAADDPGAGFFYHDDAVTYTDNNFVPRAVADTHPALRTGTWSNEVELAVGTGLAVYQHSRLSTEDKDWGTALAIDEVERVIICLVPNSTHLTQPLDVGFFRPLKIAWRQTLEDWKKNNLRTMSVPKESFPHLLKKAIIIMDQKPPNNDKDACTELSAIKRNLVSSFKATGIVPFDRNRVLNKLPPESPSPEIETVVRDSLTQFLREQRFGNELQPPRKRTRLQIEPGKSISTADETSTQEMTSMQQSMQSPVPIISEPSTSYQTSQDDNNHNITDCDSDAENIVPNHDRNTLSDFTQIPTTGQFILAKFGSQKGKKTYHYVCSIEDVIGTKLIVQGYKSQKKSKTIFKEVPKDVSIIETSDIVTYLPKPKYINECYSFPNDVMIKEL